jgi:dihydroflavonol-4-reductase
MALAIVTGATGMIGTHLVRALRARRWKVLALVRRDSQTAALEALGATPVRTDLLDRGRTVAAVPEGADVIFHLAGASWNMGLMPDYLTRVNEDGLRNIIFAATDRRATCLVNLTDAVIYGPQESLLTEESPLADPRQLNHPYERTRRECEAIFGRAVARGLDAVSVVASAVLGAGLRPHHSMLFRILHERPDMLVPPGGRCFIGAEVLADTLIAAAEKGRTGQRYLVGGPPLSWHEVLERYAAANGLDTALKPYRKAGFLPSWLNRLGAGSSLDVNREDYRLLTRSQHLSCDLCAAELGCPPGDLDIALRALASTLRPL